jgi:hypothetical protein
VTGHCTDTPAFADEQNGLHPKAWKVWIGRVWHTSEEYGRCCQAIEPLRSC